MSENAVNVARSKLANEVKKSKRDGDPTSHVVQEARCALAAEKLAAIVRRTVEAAPPLSDAQRERIAAILWSGR